MPLYRVHRTRLPRFAHPRGASAQVEPPCRCAVAQSHPDTSKLIAQAAVEQRLISQAHWLGDGRRCRRRGHLAVDLHLAVELGGVRYRSGERTLQTREPLDWGAIPPTCAFGWIAVNRAPHHDRAETP